MFEDFFGLREDPFNVSPDPHYLFQTPNTREALACLTYAIQRRKGFVLLTGEVGTGKTTLLNKLLEWLRGEQLSTAFIFNPRLDANQFLEFAMADFGIDTDSEKKSQVLLRLNQWLLERYRAGETAVLIVDEAQNLSLEVLEEIRLLTNLETSTEKLLQIVLSGQPELEHMLKQPQLRQLLQRIVLRCKTYPLTLEQTGGYIVERLHIAGADSEPIFTPGAMALVYQYSQGIPRLINLLCEHALITSFAEDQKLVSERTIVAVAHEFELDAARPVEKPESGGKSERTPTEKPQRER
jgi:type II secretory pathway predicted ATPase ExeA